MPETNSASIGDRFFQDQRRNAAALPSAKPAAVKGLVAPFIKSCLLGPSMFAKVDCFDVSAGGFWYLTETRLNRQTLVVSLQNEGDLVHVLADVVNCAPVNFAGVDAFQVRCEFRGDVSARQSQILRQMWLLDQADYVAGRELDGDDFSCDQIF